MTLIVIILKTLGSIIDSTIDWTFLTNLFGILRFFWNSINWLLDIPTLLFLIGLTITFDIAENVFDAGIITIKWFK